MKNLVLLMVIASTTLFACKTQSGAMGADRIEPANTGNDKTNNEIQNEVYDVIVSFISIAFGVDKEALKRVDDAIAKFNEENKTSITPEKAHWGREGEFDYNIKLKNLSTAKKKEFAMRINAAIGSSELVHIAFNKKAVHK